MRPLSSTLIVPRRSRIDVEFQHDTPALAGEWYAVTVNISNKESFALKDLNVEFSLADENSELGG